MARIPRFRIFNTTSLQLTGTREIATIRLPSGVTAPRPPLLMHSSTFGQWAPYRRYAQGIGFTMPSKDPRVAALLSQTDYIRSIAPPVFQSLDNSGLSSDEAYKLLDAISVREPNNGTALKDLPGVLDILIASGLSATEALNYLLAIITKTHNCLYFAFEDFPKAFARFTDAGIAPAKARTIIMTLFEEMNTPAPFSAVFTTLTQSGLTADAAYGYLRALVDKTDTTHRYILGKTLFEFPNVFTTLIASGLTADQACAYLSTVIDKNFSGAKYAFESLPQVFDELTGQGLSPAEARSYYLRMVSKVGGYVKHTYGFMPHFFSKLVQMGLTLAQARDYLMEITDRAGTSIEYIVAAFFPPDNLFHDTVPLNDRRSFLSDYMRIIKATTAYNAGWVISAFNNFDREMHLAPVGVLLSYTELMATIMERHPRIGFNVLEGVGDAIKQGILPKDAAPDQTSILHFVARSHGFIPALYRDYTTRGDTVFAELDAQAKYIIREEMGLQYMRAIVTAHGHHGYEHLLAMIQRASPTSGANVVGKSNQISLLQEMMAVGDLRGHIPIEWQKQVKSFAIESGEYRLHQGVALDPDGHIKALVQDLQEEPRTLASSKRTQELQRALHTRLIVYIQAGPEDKAAAMQGVQHALYALASSREPIRVQLGMVDDLDYTTLTLLEQLFTDKDNIPVLLQTEVNRITALAHRNKLIVNIPGLAKQLTQAWTQDASAEDRRARITGTLQSYRVADLQRLAQHPTLAPEVRDMVSDLAHQTSAVRPEQIDANLVEAVLNSALTIIRGERNKFHYVKTAETTVGIRPVKGPAFGLHGLSSGVCTAADMVAWANPDFKLFAITLEDRDQAVGYVQAFEVRDGGKKYLTLPGINPSTEFLGTVQASALYPKLMAQISAFAKEADYDAVLIPKAPLVHSNRTGISKAIQRAGYPTHTFENAVQWNSVRGHDFSEAYIINSPGR